MTHGRLAPLLAVAALALVGCGESADATKEAPTPAAGPSHVESEACRTAGADVLEDAEKALDTTPAENAIASRYADLVAGSLSTVALECSAEAVEAFTALSEALADYVAAAYGCQFATTAGFGSDCEPDDDMVSGEFAAADGAVDEARALLDAKEG